MLRAFRLSTAPSRTDGVLVLSYDARQKHRFLARLEDGSELAVELPRGSVLADGDVLETSAGTHVLVRAAAETLSVARAPDALLLARVAYHLGNRHVALEITSARVKYRHDHVLDDMVQRLGAEVTCETAPFFPEGGAYGRGSRHGHGHAHQHAGEHEHPHDHEHGAAREPGAR
jgi:urease accessory protein